ncbi:hypothetical protein Misp05_19300 [Micromonospora sp. NBRC 107095]|nr:hypothetical protein Misp05_19300 [Micromonospora sp. NBRC 107095]
MIFRDIQMPESIRMLQTLGSGPGGVKVGREHSNTVTSNTGTTSGERHGVRAAPAQRAPTGQEFCINLHGSPPNRRPGGDAGRPPGQGTALLTGVDIARKFVRHLT